MRTLSRAVSGLVALVLAMALVVFAIENQRALRAQFLGQGFAANLWWVVVGAAVLGALCSLCLVVPGRVAAGWRNRTLRHQQTHQELNSLRSEHTTRANWDQERAALAAENLRLHEQQGGTASPTEAASVER